MSKSKKATYRDRFLDNTNSDREIQGLFVKLPFMDRFCPVIAVYPIDEDETGETLKVVVSSDSVPVFPPAPDPSCFAPGDSCTQNFFVHKSQAIFRTCERYSASPL